MCDERGTGRSLSLDCVEDSRRQAGVCGRFGVSLCGERRHVARLHDDGVAEQEGRNDVRMAEVEREIERPYDADDAVRVMLDPLPRMTGDGTVRHLRADPALHDVEA